MSHQAAHLRALYDIAVSIGGTLDLDILAKATVSAYHRKLHCVATSLIEDSQLGLSIHTSYGLGAKMHGPLLERIEKTEKPNTGHVLCYFPDQDFHHTVFELPKFGALILTTTDKIKLAIERDLVTLNQNLASACVACLQNKLLLQKEHETHKALKSKTEFLSQISHELRTPMNAVIGFSTLLLKNTHVERAPEFAERILTASNALMQLINDMLDYNNLESPDQKLQTHACCIEKTIFPAIEPLAKYAELKGISLSMDQINATSDNPLNVITDGKKLTHVLSRITDNAVKFCASGDNIKVHFSVEECTDAEHKGQNQLPCTLTFRIEDTGPGIPQGVVDNIFDPFHQSDTATKQKHQGAGLGLAICQKIILQNGGHIAVCPSKTGCHIEFSWPCQRVISTPKRKALMDCNILIVDDNEVNRQVLEVITRKMGPHIYTAENGLIAVNSCQDTQFDIIFMDYHMPMMNGVDATKIIRQLSDHYRGIPIIGLTADVTKEARQQCLEAGMTSVLNKPLDHKNISTITEEILQQTTPTLPLVNRKG